MPLDLTDDKSILVHVMAWCRQARSHYLNQCWPRSPTPYGVTRPQWVNSRHPIFYPQRLAMGCLATVCWRKLTMLYNRKQNLVMVLPASNLSRMFFLVTDYYSITLPNSMPTIQLCCIDPGKTKYRQVSNISRTLVGNKIVDHSDVVGASPVGAAPTTSSFSTWLQQIG